MADCIGKAICNPIREVTYLAREVVQEVTPILAQQCEARGHVMVLHRALVVVEDLGESHREGGRVLCYSQTDEGCASDWDMERT